MFLDMLTADAASKHGHEFSDAQPQVNRWLGGGRRSPFKVLPYTARPRLPTRSRSVRGIVGELGELPEEVDATAVLRYHDMSVDDLHIPGSYRNDSPPISPPRARSVTPRLITDLTASCIEQPPSERAPSVTASSTSDKKSRRPKTQFSVAVPPPCSLPLRKQGIARPRAFFQLQTRADSRFHRPIYELVPLSRIDGTRKVGQLIRRLGKVKENITNDDLAVVRVESYNNTNTRRESIDISETRDVLGIISPMPRTNGSQSTQAQIFLDGAMWEATTGNNGRYNLQCIGTDKHAARWYVPRTQKKRAQSPGGSADADRKLYFAAILPHTTKHPTLASLSRTNLDIYDWYTLNTEANSADALTPLETTTPLSRGESSASAWLEQHTETSSTNVFNVPIDELHRKLIVVSSFWVMLCEGWSSQYSFPTAASSTSNASSLPTGDRSMSLPVTKEDKLSISSAAAPASTLSTRQTTPERLSMSAASPAPSVHTEASQPKSNRLSLSSFTFKRLQSGSSVKHDDSVPPSQKDVKSFTDTSSDQPHDHLSPVTPQLSDHSATVETIAKRRGAEDVAATAKASRTGPSRFGSIVRRMSNSVTSREGQERRSRSISWKWQPPFRGDSNNDSKIVAEPLATEKAVVAPVFPSADIDPNFPLDELVDDDNVIEIESVASPSLQEPAVEETIVVDNGARRNTSPVAVVVLPSADDKLYATPDVGAQVVKMVSSEPLEPKDSPLASHRRWSTSSSDSQEHDMTTPYWKDFDRMQMHNFWRRASSSSGTATVSGKSAYIVDSVLDESGVSKDKTTIMEDDVMESIEPTQEVDSLQRPTSMMDSIRQSWRRRKPSLTPGDLPSIISS